MRKATWYVIIILILIASGACSDSNPVSPEDSGTLPGSSDDGTSLVFSPDMNRGGHHVLGAWELIFDFENETARAIPQRFAGNHFNVRKFMETAPCSTCLTLSNFLPQPDYTFYIDVSLEHPFPGLDQFTGFDIRGIAIFNGSYTFPASHQVMSDYTLGDVELLNTDGLTPLFNPVDFAEGTSLPLFTYTKGKFATPLATPATLNGFRAFFPDAERRHFVAGETDTKTYHIARPSGTLLRVGYVVDASWDFPINTPVEDPITDFGPNANSIEAYKIEASIGTGLMPGCGYAPYQVDVYDHQGSSTIEMITLESPDLMSGVLSDPSGTDMGDFTRFTGNIPNELEVGEGTYRVLVGAVDKTEDPYLGTLAMFTVTDATVEFVPIEYDEFWRKDGKTLDNNNYNPYETEFDTTITEAWTVEYTSGIGYTYESTPVVGMEAVYFVTDYPFDPRIRALDLDTGDEIWSELIKYQPDVAIYRCAPLIGYCEVYVGGSSVYCYDSEDGDYLWGFEGDDTQYVHGSPAISEEILVIWGSNNTLYAFEAYTGGFLWDYTQMEFPGNSGTVVIEDGVVYAAGARGNAFALNLYNGDEIWQISFPGGGPVGDMNCWAAPVMADGLIWFPCFNCNLYGVDPLDGSIDVTVPLDDRIPWAAPAFDGTYLYQPVAYDPNYWQSFEGPYGVMAISTDGTVEWEFPGVDVEAFWTQPVVANGVVFVPSDAGYLYMLNPADGTEVATAYEFDAPVKSGMAIQDGRLYLMDTAGKFYCLE